MQGLHMKGLQKDRNSSRPSANYQGADNVRNSAKYFTSIKRDDIMTQYECLFKFLFEVRIAYFIRKRNV